MPTDISAHYMLRRIILSMLAVPALALGAGEEEDLSDMLPPWLLEADEEEEAPEPEAAPRTPSREGLSAPTPELQAELKRRITEAMHAAFPSATGGPGLTEDTAWRLGAESYPDPSMLFAVLPEDAEEFDICTLTGKNGRKHLLMEFTLPREGKVYCCEFWVDTHDAAPEPTEEDDINAEEEAEEGAVELS